MKQLKINTNIIADLHLTEESIDSKREKILNNKKKKKILTRKIYSYISKELDNNAFDIIKILKDMHIKIDNKIYNNYNIHISEVVTKEQLNKVFLEEIDEIVNQIFEEDILR